VTPGDQHAVETRIAQHDVTLALVSLLSLHEQADEVRLDARMRDGRVERALVEYFIKGRSVGGFEE
jgi:hypothetical protein